MACAGQGVEGRRVKAFSAAEMLERDEGYVEHAYQDSMEGKCHACGKSNGYWTIGIGHLIDKRKGGRIPRDIIYQILARDLSEKTEQLYQFFPWAMELDEPRRAVLICMTFQLGIDGLRKFKKAMDFMEKGAWYAAANEFLNSIVAKEQAPERWKRFANQIRTGEWQ
jgi:lysozyme